MQEDQILHVKETHATKLRASSNWLFLYFTIAVGLGICAAATRAPLFGPLYYVGIPIFLIFFVAPPLLWPLAKHPIKRTALLLLGLFLLAITGLTYLGLPSAAWMVLLTTPILSAALIGPRGAYLALALAILISLTFGTLYATRTLEANIPDFLSFSSDWRNWMVMTSALLLSGIACITLTENLRKQGEDTNLALSTQDEQMRALVEYAPEAIMIFDMDLGVFTNVNPRAEEIFGYRRDELVGAIGPRELTPAMQTNGTRSSAAISTYLAQALAGGFPVFEWQHQHKSGKRLDCEVSLVRLPPHDRKLIRASVMDISARKAEIKEHERVQQKLARSQKLEAVGKLTGGIAHDFNNLLAVTLGNLELLRDEIDDNQQLKLIDTSIAATLRGADLTRNLLAFARKASLKPSLVDINKVVLDTRKLVSRTLPATISVETSLLAELWPVEVDPGSTESALLNLILNACDAMPDGGRLTIETANIRIESSYMDTRQEELKPGRYAMLAISDTGAGIRPDHLSEIFEPFFSTKDVGSNSGLGLSMVHGFMRQSGGTVQVYSEPGVGTTFKLFFNAHTSAAPPSPAAAGPSDTCNTGLRLLLAEDDEDVLSVLVKTLERDGYAVTAARSGDAAKAIFEADPHFDLLITDIVMPGGLQGTTLSSELRRMVPELPVIFMSGYASEATVHGNGLRREDIRLMKPVRRGDLQAAIKESLQNKR
ncbi:ATP-binding protein [Pseudophaeobacter sp.]|uniref:ATP-binding protein n=1 Tax=Pseudophaeobacter sp. TaxID=1971739 RepID=UPI00405896BE